MHSDLSRSILSKCTTQLITDSWLVCVANVPIGASGNTSGLNLNLPFAIWDSGSLVVVPLNMIIYSFPTVPQLLGVTGCDPKALEDDWIVPVQTTNCPTLGNVTLIVSTANIILPVTVSIGTNKLVTDSRMVGSALHVTLPPGTGQGISLQVRCRCLFCLFYFYLTYSWAFEPFPARPLCCTSHVFPITSIQ